MGRLEKQIMIGALALVGVLVAVVILKGLAPRDEAALDPTNTSDWSGAAPALMLGPDGQPLAGEPAPSAADLGAATVGAAPPEAALQDPLVVDLGAAPPAADPLLQDPLTILPAEPLPAAGDLVAAPAPDPESYKIRSGDTLGHIAQRELGSVRYMDRILQLNPGLDPNALVVGKEIKMPKRSELPALPPRATGTGGAAASASAAPAGDSGQTHVVAAGDTLWSIASRYLGDGNRAGEIVAANPDKLKSRDSLLKIGMKLRIPKR